MTHMTLMTEPDTGREVSRAPASCDLSSMLGLSTLLEERCSLGCNEDFDLYQPMIFPPRTFNHWSHIQSVSSVLRHVGWRGSLRAETIWWSTHQPEPSAGQLARFCFGLQRPSHVCHFSGHFWWVESHHICISASGVHSSSILVAPDVSIVYQDKAWKLGDLKLWSPRFCLIRSHSFRSLNFDALQGPILMKNLLQVLMVGQWGFQVDCENLPCLSVLQLQSTKHHLSNQSPCLMVKSTPNDYWIAKKRQQTFIILLVTNPHPKLSHCHLPRTLPPFFFLRYPSTAPGDRLPRNVTAVGTTKGPRLAVHVVDTFDSVLEIVLELAKMTGEKWDFDHHLMGFIGI